MRVWALASCGGLLALAACSAEQSKVPAPGEMPQDGDNRAQVDAEPEIAPTTLSPTAAPELSPRPGLPSSARRPMPSPPSAAVAGQGTAQSTELRTRLQRLRAQHSARLSLSAGPVASPSQRSSPLVRSPLVTAPLPAQLPASPTSAAPAPGAQPAGVPAQAGVPEAQTAPAGSFRSGVSQAVAASTPLAVAPSLGDSPAPAGTATDLGPLASVRPDPHYPIAPRRHQGYSTRRSPAVLVLGPQPEAALATAAVPRLHGEGSAAPGTAVVLSPAPEVPGPATQAAPAPASPSEASATSEAPVSPGQHQGDGAFSSALEVRSRSLGRSQALAQRPTAISQPESLPLHSSPPSLRQLRPQPLEPGAEDAGRATAAAIAEPGADLDGDRSAATAEMLPLLPGEQGDWFSRPEAVKSRLVPCPGSREATIENRRDALATPVPELSQGVSAMARLGTVKVPDSCATNPTGESVDPAAGEGLTEAL